MLTLPVIITPLRTYLYGQTSFWMEVICLQHLLIKYLEKYIFLKLPTRILFLPAWNRLSNFRVGIFFGQREIIWVRKTGYLYKKGQLARWNLLTELPLSSYSYQSQQKWHRQPKKSAEKYLYGPEEHRNYETTLVAVFLVTVNSNK